MTLALLVLLVIALGVAVLLVAVISHGNGPDLLDWAPAECNHRRRGADLEELERGPAERDCRRIEQT